MSSSVLRPHPAKGWTPPDPSDMRSIIRVFRDKASVMGESYTDALYALSPGRVRQIIMSLRPEKQKA